MSGGTRITHSHTTSKWSAMLPIFSQEIEFDKMTRIETHLLFTKVDTRYPRADRAVKEVSPWKYETRLKLSGRVT